MTWPWEGRRSFVSVQEKCSFTFALFSLKYLGIGDRSKGEGYSSKEREVEKMEEANATQL